MNRRNFQIRPGAASLLLIAVVMSMSVLGVLSLVSARSDAKLSERSVAVAQSAAAIDVQGERSLALLDAALAACQDAENDAAYLQAVAKALPEGMHLMGRTVTWEESIEERKLECRAEIEKLGEFPRVHWTAHRLYSEIIEDDFDEGSVWFY